MSPDTADALFSLANGVAILGGVLAVLGTSGIFFAGSIREHYASQREAELRAGTAEAQRGAAAANERAAELNRESEQLRLDLERERIERLRIEERFAPRRMTEKLRDDLVSSASLDGETTVILRVLANNAEGLALLNEVKEACLSAGWIEGRVVTAEIVGSGLPEGVTVTTNPEDAAGVDLANGFLNAFMAAGLASAAPSVADSAVPRGAVAVSIGMKPDPAALPTSAAA